MQSQAQHLDRTATLGRVKDEALPLASRIGFGSVGCVDPSALIRAARERTGSPWRGWRCVPA